MTNDAAYNNASAYFADINGIVQSFSNEETGVDYTETPPAAITVQHDKPVQEPVGSKKGESGSLLLVVVVVIAVLATLIAVLSKKSNRNSSGERAQVTLPFDSENGEDSIYKFGYAQTKGARQVQEDAMGAENTNSTKVLVERGVLAMVADGAGLEKNGEYASHVTVSVIGNGFINMTPGEKPENCLLELCAKAQSELCAYKEKSGTQLGCSMVSVLIRAGEVYFLSVGDCRLYLYRSNTLLQLNREHVCYTDTGAVSPPGSMHSDGISGRSKDVISYIGKDNLNRIDRNINAFNMMTGDRLLLMTDGVYDALSEDEMLACIKGSALQSAQNIIQAVDKKQLPGQDNATVLVIAR